MSSMHKIESRVATGILPRFAEVMLRIIQCVKEEKKVRRSEVCAANGRGSPGSDYRYLALILRFISEKVPGYPIDKFKSYMRKLQPDRQKAYWRTWRIFTDPKHHATPQTTLYAKIAKESGRKPPFSLADEQMGRMYQVMLYYAVAILNEHWHPVNLELHPMPRIKDKRRHNHYLTKFPTTTYCPIVWQGSKRKPTEIKVISQRLAEMSDRAICRNELVEAFCGSAIVSLMVKYHKPSIQLWLNDINPALVQFLKWVRDEPEYLIHMLYTDLPDEDKWRSYKEGEHTDGWKMFYRIYYSYGQFNTGFGVHQACTQTRQVSKFIHANRLLKGAKITNYDFRTLLRHKAVSRSILYLDPPYWGERQPYSHPFVEQDHHDLKSVLDGRGNWLMSYNDCEQVRGLYDPSQITTIKSTKTTYVTTKMASASRDRSELLIIPY